MERTELDDIDRGILYFLQENARENTATFIGEQLGVSGTTVSNRTNQLKQAGVIRGFHPEIDYERAGFDLRALLVCTVAESERTSLAQQALSVHGVVNVRKMLSGRNNLHIEVVARSTNDLERITDEIADFGIEIACSNIMTDELAQPWPHFYVDDNGNNDGEPA